MTRVKEILILGATYGALLATKLQLSGHNCTMVCLPDEASLINAEGLRTRIPVRGRENLVEIDTRKARGTVRALGPADARPEDYDLIALAMQEPQYRLPGVRELLARVAASGRATMSIMNMPPLPYLARIPGVDPDALRHCYADPSVWDGFDPQAMTLASPDPQAFRPPDAPANVLQVSLPTNFKCAAFVREHDTAILRTLEADIMATRFDAGDATVELPVKLKVHDSVHVPLAKWAMLMTGNYRCITPDGPRAIRDAVHSDIEASRAIYEWVCGVCVSLGAPASDMVPFEKYANAAQGLAKPSSAARALYGGAPFIERVDRLVQGIAAGLGRANSVLDETVALVDAQLDKNRAAAA